MKNGSGIEMVVQPAVLVFGNEDGEHYFVGDGG